MWPCWKKPEPFGESVEDLLAEQHRADGLVAAAEALGDRHQVGRDAVLLAGVQRAGATHAAHHLVEDQEHAVAVADLADAPEIAGSGGHRSRRRADDGFRDEGHHGVRAELENFVFERLCGAQAVGLLALAGFLVAVGVARVDVMRLDQQRAELARGAISLPPAASAPSVLP